MKNIAMKNIVYFDPKKKTVEVKRLYSDDSMSAARKGYSAVCRARDAGIVARYCDPAKLEATKAEVLALATDSKPTESKVDYGALSQAIMDTFGIHMAIKYMQECGNYRTLQYKNRDKFIAAAKEPTVIEAGFRIVNVDFGDGKVFTYLADKAFRTAYISVPTPYGLKKAKVVHQGIRTTKALVDMAAKYGKEVTEFFKVIR